MGIADKLRSLSLPGNWQVRTDEEGNQFYWNSHTFKKQSTRPTALELGWREQMHIDHETGEVYVYNILTRQRGAGCAAGAAGAEATAGNRAAATYHGNVRGECSPESPQVDQRWCSIRA